jgi:hypothetical protein
MLTALRTARPLFQSTPEPEARALPTRYGLADERTWLRAALPAEFAAASAEVAGVLAGHPEHRPGPDTLTDAAAVRLYLGALGVGLDAVLRRGEPGPQVPFARCVASGLGRLPAYRGATLLSAELTAADRAALRDRGIVTDWGFTQALTEPSADLPGSTGVLIWSLTGRRTRLLEPADGHRVDARVVFLPGTAFKVLSAPGTGPVLLREVAADELSHGPVPFDDFTVAALFRAVERWRTPFRVGPAAAPRFLGVPGMTEKSWKDFGSGS